MGSNVDGGDSSRPGPAGVEVALVVHMLANVEALESAVVGIAGACTEVQAVSVDFNPTVSRGCDGSISACEEGGVIAVSRSVSSNIANRVSSSSLNLSVSDCRSLDEVGDGLNKLALLAATNQGLGLGHDDLSSRCLSLGKSQLTPESVCLVEASCGKLARSDFIGLSHKTFVVVFCLVISSLGSITVYGGVRDIDIGAPDLTAGQVSRCHWNQDHSSSIIGKGGSCANREKIIGSYWVDRVSSLRGGREVSREWSWERPSGGRNVSRVG